MNSGSIGAQQVRRCLSGSAGNTQREITLSLGIRAARRSLPAPPVPGISFLEFGLFLAEAVDQRSSRRIIPRGSQEHSGLVFLQPFG